MNGSRSVVALLGILFAAPALAQTPDGEEIKTWLAS